MGYQALLLILGGLLACDLAAEAGSGQKVPMTLAIMLLAPLNKRRRTAEASAALAASVKSLFQVSRASHARGGIFLVPSPGQTTPLGQAVQT